MLEFVESGSVRLVIAVIVLSTFTIVVQAIYNLLFHPLSSVPGPLLARVSHVPSWYHTITGYRHLWLFKLHQTYGSKVRIAPNAVVFRHPDAYRDIYNTKSNVQRAPYYEAWKVWSTEQSTFLTTDKKEHARLRKLLNQVFTEQSLRAAEPFMIKHIDRWNKLLVADNDWSSPANFATLADALLFDIMGDLSFGADFGIKELGENPRKIMPHLLSQNLQFMYRLTRSPMLNLIIWLKPRGLDHILNGIAPKKAKEYKGWVQNYISQRLQLHETEKAKEGQRQDMFWFLKNAKKEDGTSAFTDRELGGEAHTFIIAGSDTAAMALAATIFYLTCNSVPYKRVVREILSKFSSPEEITSGPQLLSCVYLRACIDEAMRLSPSLPSDLPRKVLPGGAVINNEYFPKGTIVASSNWVAGYNEDVYGDAEVFRPERWIPDEKTGVTREDVQVLRANFHPFAQGPGSCPGQNMAILELLLTVARTLHRFEVRRAPGCEGEDIYQVRDSYIAARDGPMVQFKRRVGE